MVFKKKEESSSKENSSKTEAIEKNKVDKLEDDDFFNEKKQNKKLSISEMRSNNITAVLAGIKKKFGDSAIRNASSYSSVRRISSGVFLLDNALGGGWPIGVINEIFGMESSSKTTLMLKMVADAQARSVISNKYLFEDDEKENKIPYTCAWIDVEGCFNKEWAEIHGVNTSDLQVAQPGSQEETGDILQALVKAYDIIVLDSLAAMSPEAEVESSMSDNLMAAAARGNNKIFRKIQSTLNDLAKLYNDEKTERSLPTIFIINQLRETINPYGAKTTKPGGKGQDFYSTIQLAMKKGKVENIKQGDMEIPGTVSHDFLVEKNKVSAPKCSGNFKMALVDDPAGLFRKGQVIEIQGIFEYLEKTGMISGDSKSGWVLSGKNISKTFKEEELKFKTKKEFVRNWFYIEKNFTLLKKDLLLKLNPDQ